MDFKQLEHFIAAYEAKSFTAAASHMNISQQGLSKSIRRLEDELDAPLFLRIRNHLFPTSFGELMYTQALHMTKELEITLTLLQNEKEKAAPLKIGFAASVFSVLNMDSHIWEFKKLHPEIFMEISNETDYVCEEKIENGDLDIAFSMGPFSSGDFLVHLLMEENICALVPIEHPLAALDTLHIQDFRSESIITSDVKNKGCAMLMEDFAKKGIPPHISFWSNDPHIHLQLTKKSLGISLAPEHWLSLLGNPEDIRSIPVEGLQKRKIYMIQKNICQNNTGLKTFAEFIRKKY